MSNEINRREFLGLTGLSAGAYAMRHMLDYLNNSPKETINGWPTLSIETLPQEISEIIKVIPQTKIDLKGNLVGGVVSYATGSSIIAPETELGKFDFPDGKIRWAAILQKAVNPKDSLTKSHFSVDFDGISQNVKPGPHGNPLVVWNLTPLDMDSYKIKGNPYVQTMSGLAINPEYKTDNFKPLLVEIYDGAPVGICRRAINIKINGDLTDRKVMASTLSMVRALGKYGITPWEVLDNLEAYGPEGDHRYDLGIENITKIRYLMGIWALTDGDVDFKKQIFGEFIKDGENYKEAVKRYFAANREYLLRLVKPIDVQTWDVQTKYWLFQDALMNVPEIPTADYFVQPVDHNSGGGYRFAEEISDDEDPDKLLGLYHTGYDFNVGSGNEDLGLPFWPIAKGVVVFSGYVNNGLGNILIIRHRLTDGSEIYSRYAHLDKRYAVAGQIVGPGDLIGTIGMSGHQKYAHLHVDVPWSKTYELFMKDRPWFYPSGSKDEVERYFIDPLKFIKDHKLEVKNPSNRRGAQEE